MGIGFIFFPAAATALGLDSGWAICGRDVTKGVSAGARRGCDVTQVTPPQRCDISMVSLQDTCHHPWLHVRPGWDTDEAMSFLLPSLVLLVASTAVLLATRIWKARKRLGSRAGASRCCRAALGAPGAPRAEETPPQGPAAPESALYIPCGCGPCCTPCVTAARELQDLVTPLWPEVSFPRDSEMWQLSWEDLEQLLEQGRLPCCASSSSSGSIYPSRTPAGEGDMDRSGCSLTAAGMRRSRSSLRMHVARKSLEVKLRAQPLAVRQSQERLGQGEASSPSTESLPGSESPGGSCQSPDAEEASDRSSISAGSADISGARSALRMHVAKKSLEVKLGARPAPVRNSQQRAAQQEASRSPWSPTRSASGRPSRSESEKILQRQRELEFPHLRGAPTSRMRPLLAAQMLLRMLCFK